MEKQQRPEDQPTDRWIDASFLRMAHSMPVHDEALFMAAMTENIQIAANSYVLQEWES